MSDRVFKIPDIDIASKGALDFDWLIKRIWGGPIFFDRVRLVYIIKKTLSPEYAFVMEARARRISLKDIGDLTGVSGARVRQIEAACTRKLRHSSRSRFYRIPFEYILEEGENICQPK